MYNVSGNRNNLLVAAATGQMMVYCHKRLVWAAKGDTCPVAVRVATFAGLQGLVLTLDDAGKLVLSYMGTDPPMQSVDVRHSAEVDFAALDSEYREVAGRIQALGAPTEAVVPLQQLLITAQVPSLLDRSEDLPQDMLSGSAFSAVTVHLYLRHSGAASLTDVTLSLDALPGLHLDQDCITVPHVSSTDSSAVIVRLQARGSGVPSDNTLKAVATYASSSGEPRTTSTKVTLPLSLFCQLVAPQQAAVFKVTLDTNRPPPQLADLFQDMVAQAQMDLQQHGQYANVMSFKYTRGPVVTILVSKSAGRYRIQSDSFGAMWLIVQELCQRLRNFFSTAESSEQEHAGSQEDFAITSKEAVPLEELWASIEKHCQARQAVAASQAALSDRAQQQRAVQKRLLMCFKDRQPGSLAHLELLLAETFDQLVDLGELLMLISLP
ncbi:TPA: Protein PTHB1, variant 2 [Trebouxia sp. C0004]